MKVPSWLMKYGLPITSFLLGIAIHFFLLQALESTHSEEHVILIFVVVLTAALATLSIAVTAVYQGLQEARKDYDSQVLKKFEESKNEVISKVDGSKGEVLKGVGGTLEKVEGTLESHAQELLDNITMSFGATMEQHTRIKQEIDEFCQKLGSGQAAINRGIEQLSNFLGLTVRFVDETKGESYQESIELIKRAQKSLTFVDFWVQTDEYLEDHPPAERQIYYDAILEQIEKHRVDRVGMFHKRIIQLPELAKSPPKEDIVAGSVFREFALRCLAIQDESPHATSFKVAPPSIQASFVIIDDEYMIWLILSYHPTRGNLARRGIIIFRDPRGDFIRRMLDIYFEIDNQAQPLRPEHLVGRTRKQASD